MSTLVAEEAELRDRRVQRIILIEGAANALVLVLKLVVGLATGSIAILGDAIHSLTDIANNGVAWVVMRLSTQPPDERHPYGHRKFETVAVFGLAMLLTVLAFELGSRALARGTVEIVHSGWALGLMACVLAINATLATWQGWWARRLESDILRADARHTFADVLTTLVVIAGWQAAARGHPWFDSVAALAVSATILALAYGLFRRAIPVLVDQSALDTNALIEAALSVQGVLGVRRVRSRGSRIHAAVDLEVVVAPELTTVRSHAIATEVERAVRERFAADSVVVHVEPANSGSLGATGSRPGSD